MFRLRITRFITKPLMIISGQQALQDTPLIGLQGGASRRSARVLSEVSCIVLRIRVHILRHAYTLTPQSLSYITPDAISSKPDSSQIGPRWQSYQTPIVHTNPQFCVANILHLCKFFAKGLRIIRPTGLRCKIAWPTHDAIDSKRVHVGQRSHSVEPPLV